MPTISATFSFIQKQYGWTEKFYKMGESPDLSTYYAGAVALSQKRIALSGTQTSGQYLRLSTEGVRGDSLLYAWEPGTMNGHPQYSSDTPTTVLLHHARDVTRSFRKTTYLRGIWDVLVADGGVYQPTSEFNSYYAAWLAELIAGGWGWLATNRPNLAHAVIGAVQLPATGQVRITVAGAMYGPARIGVPTQIRLSGIQGARTLNGTVLVIPETDTVAVTAKPHAILPYTTGGFARLGELSFKAIASGQIFRAGRRDTGRPILVPRGRARNRVRG